MTTPRIMSTMTGASVYDVVASSWAFESAFDMDDYDDSDNDDDDSDMMVTRIMMTIWFHMILK